MKDCNNDIQNYLADRVKLPPAKNTDLTARRDANRQRLKKGLAEDERPAPIGFVTQGSRAMKTTIQEDGNAYDIDDGSIFEKDDLVGSQGAEMSSLDARKMVRKAVDDGSFKTPPEIRTNCVRVKYNDGPQVDIPVYRKLGDGSYELASASWRKSDPEGVNEWFKNAANSKVGEGADKQFRHLIQLQKKLCSNRPSYSLPSGFVHSVLTNEVYFSFDERLDCAFRNRIQNIYNRLCRSLQVSHPVVAENLAEADDIKTRNYRNILATALEDLKVLDKNNCLRSEALKAWKKVFHTDYFDDAIEEAEESEKERSKAAVANLFNIPQPWCA